MIVGTRKTAIFDLYGIFKESFTCMGLLLLIAISAK